MNLVKVWAVKSRGQLELYTIGYHKWWSAISNRGINVAPRVHLAAFMVNQRLTRQALAALWALWKFSRFCGQLNQDVRAWLRQLEEGAQTLGIPNSQFVPTALHFLKGEIQTLMQGTTVYLIRNLSTLGLTCSQIWIAFKDALINVHGEPSFHYNLSRSNIIQIAESKEVHRIDI